MDLRVVTLTAVVVVLLMNHAVTRLARLGRIPFVFWVTTAADLAMAVGVLWFGLPGLNQVAGVRVLVAMVFLLHAVQNLSARAQWDREARQAEMEALRAEYEALQDREQP